MFLEEIRCPFGIYCIIVGIEEPNILHPMIHCTNCGHVNAEGASQCEACYDALPALTSCPTCQTSVPDDAFFCPQCGASLPRGVSHQGDAAPNVADEPSLTAPPAFDLPPTNVVAQEALGASPVPPTDVVSFPESADLPPTNVVNVAPPSDLPPTNVVNVAPPSDLPPTNVVNPSPLPYVAETIPPQSPPAYTPEQGGVDEIETVPTMVVSPGSNRDVIEPPPIQASPSESLPVVPPTMPPQSPPAYQTPPPIEAPSPIESPIEPPIKPPIEPPIEPPVIETPPEQGFQPIPERPEREVPPSFEVPSTTTVQPYALEPIPVVGETLIQLPSAQLIHERTEARIKLPNQDVILIGKTTDTIMPDVDVSSFVDSAVVSRRHAAIFMDANGYSIEDLGSSNGTYVNDECCERGDRVQLNSGDRIGLGRENKVGFIFKIG